MVFDEAYQTCECPEGYFWMWSDENSEVNPENPEENFARCWPNPVCGENMQWNAEDYKCEATLVNTEDAPLCHPYF
jgi:hypothetical protein